MSAEYAVTPGPSRPQPFAPRVREGSSRRWPRALVALLIGLSGPVVGLLAYRGLLIGAFCLHAVAAIAAWAYWRRPARTEAETAALGLDEAPSDDLLALQAATLAAAFPVIGAPIALAVFGREGIPRDELRTAYARFIAFEHETPRWNRRVRDSQAELLREVSVRPLADQLRHGDLASKQAAAYALRRMDGDEGVTVLRQALRHHADDTRLLASLALVKLEEEFTVTLTAAREAAAADRTDAGAARVLVAVATRYARSGLPAGRGAEPLWREIEAMAARACALDQSEAADDELSIAAARQALGDPEGALAAAERASSWSAAAVAPLLLRCEMLYKLGRAAALRELAVTLRHAAVPGTDAHEIASFWASAPAALTPLPAHAELATPVNHLRKNAP